MTNVWQTMEMSKVYEALAQMTPEERLVSLKEDGKALHEQILKSSYSTKDELKERLFEFIEEYVKDQKEHYEDFTYPNEAMLGDADEIVNEMTGEKEFLEIVKQYMRSLV